MLERTHDSGGIGVEAVQLTILRAHYRVAGADLGGVGIGVVEVTQDSLFVRHGDRKAVDRNVAHAAEQVLQGLGVQGHVNRVHIFPPQGRVHDGGRERMRHRISRHAVNPRRRVHLLDAVGVAQFLRRDLAGSSLFLGRDGGEGERAAGADCEHTADEALLAHAHANQGKPLALLLQEFHHHNVVVQRGGGADDLIKIRWSHRHLFQGLVQFLGGAEIVEGQNQGSAGPQPFQLFRLRLGCGLQLDIQELAARGGGLRQDVELRSHRAPKLASTGGPPASRDDRNVGVVLHEPLDGWQCLRRPRQVI